jgi:hypothetical protein
LCFVFGGLGMMFFYRVLFDDFIARNYYYYYWHLSITLSLYQVPVLSFLCLHYLIIDLNQPLVSHFVPSSLVFCSTCLCVVRSFCYPCMITRILRCCCYPAQSPLYYSNGMYYMLRFPTSIANVSYIAGWIHGWRCWL